MRSSNRLALLSLLLFLSIPSIVTAEICFREVTSEAGIIHNGITFGTTWGDINNDGFPDIFTTNHLNTPSLYQNNGNGSFTDITKAAQLSMFADTHGSAWADFDNDGDQDLLILTGSRNGAAPEPNLFLVNTDGVLTESAVSYGLDYPLARGRTPLWLDYDNDGFLDVIEANLARTDGMAPTAIFHQTENFFVNTTASVGFDLPEGGPLCLLSYLFEPKKLNIMALGGSAKKFPSRSYGIFSQPFADISTFSPYDHVTDVVIADFNGDLRPDFFLPRVYPYLSNVFLAESDLIKGILTIASKGEMGFSFEADGIINFDLSPSFPNWVKKSDIFIGSEGRHPEDISFSLSTQNPLDAGIYPHESAVDTGVYIGYDPKQNKWQVMLSASEWKRIFVQAKAEIQISNLTTTGIVPPPDDCFMDKLVLQTNNGFVENSVAAGFDVPTNCSAAVAGDFDNDMDIDIYLVCTEINNHPNILYENQGDATFVRINNAGGAQGSELGRGENVAVADYDLDGFLDLFVTNGQGTSLFGNGPHQLFQNCGNGNHWLEIDLEGIYSNKDGIGAGIEVTASGITQMRQQDGGMHKYSQNFKRIHFGMGNNNLAEHIVINWPSGIIQELNNVQADQILKITESPSAPWPDIKANNANTDISISSSDTLSLTVSLDPGEHLGENGDWWLLADTPNGWSSYNLTTNQWSKFSPFNGITTSLQGKLSVMNSKEILNIANPSSGSYTFYFGIDLNMNSTIDLPVLFFDEITINVL